MTTSQKTFTFGNLTITKTLFDSGKSIERHLDVERLDGDISVIIGSSDPDHKKAIRLMIDEEHKNESFDIL